MKNKIILGLIVGLLLISSVSAWTPQDDLSSSYSVTAENNNAQALRLQREKIEWNHYVNDRMKLTYPTYERMIGWNTEYNSVLFKHLTIFGYNYLIDGSD